MSVFRILFFLVFTLPVLAQDLPRFESEIRAFEAADKTTRPPRRPILFTGSSSIRLWDNLASYFPGKKLLNRGFGGSELSDVIRYADRIIIPYKPKQIVLYAGENDIATGKVSGHQTYERFVTLFRYVRKRLPGVPFVFISIKPSPSRRQYRAQVDEANRLIKQFLAGQSKTNFVDIGPVMRQPNGQTIGALFKSDSLHMNEKGYVLWARELRPVLR
ncbi:lysophospholipase L1-like esterase [Spirosoma lacussanchae]|uniref:GDSL-type esterase/lipase family protein n=1 Tax=Spirosoma lacussanchae TaxID=1884249 RepID=UPI0011086BB4|nr:GDSL-type esterase/lipase family protein [Spirosoma lacussanchae]